MPGAQVEYSKQDTSVSISPERKNYFDTGPVHAMELPYFKNIYSFCHLR